LLVSQTNSQKQHIISQKKQEPSFLIDISVDRVFSEAFFEEFLMTKKSL
jgi:hypothetical protein